MADVVRTIEAVWRIESVRLIAVLARMVRDVGLAEDLAHDALEAALKTWPTSGVPSNPGAWLMTTARNKALDALRRKKRSAQKLEQWGKEQGEDFGLDRPDWDERLDRSIDDDVLGLIFAACHPLLAAESRVALTLKVLGGLTTDEIARAYLVPVATMAQRIVRAKRALSAARVSLEVPRGPELSTRLGSVLEVLYLIFNEGYAATSGEQWMRTTLCDEALRLVRILGGLLPDEGEVHGLAALFEFQASRFPSRTDRNGDPVLLLDQDRLRWDQLLLHRGFLALEQARRGPLGPFALQAEIAACHARARRADQTDWVRIAALYEALVGLRPSPVVELNRSMAVAMAYGPEAGLELIEALREDGALDSYPWLASARGELLSKLGRSKEASEEFERAAGLTRNEREKGVLLKRAADELSSRS